MIEITDPCIGCPNINLDEYGYLCDIACGKRTAWLNQIKGYELGVREVVEWVEFHTTDAIAVKDSDTSQEMVIRAMPNNLWQAQKEKWGIKNNEI